MTNTELKRWLSVKVDKANDALAAAENMQALMAGSPEEIGYTIWRAWHSVDANPTTIKLRDGVREMFMSTDMTDRERGTHVIMQHMYMVLMHFDSRLNTVQSMVGKLGLLQLLGNMTATPSEVHVVDSENAGPIKALLDELRKRAEKKED